MLNGRYQRKDNCLVEQWMKFLIFFIPEYFFYLFVKLLNNKSEMWLEKKFIDKMKFHPEKKDKEF